MLWLIIVLVLLFGAGGYPAYNYNDGAYRGHYFGGGIGLIVIILLLVYLFGGFHGSL